MKLQVRQAPSTRGFLLAVPGFLALLHPAAAASKPQSLPTLAAQAPNSREATASSATLPKPHHKTRKNATHVRHAKSGRSVTATNPVAGTTLAQHTRTNHAHHAQAHRQVRVAAHYHDASKLVIPQGDGSPVLGIAAHYLGRPYQFGSEGNAFDCSGFVRTVFAHMGVELPHSAREISAFGERVARDALEPGDLVFFHNAEHGYATHVGIYVGDDKFVHAARRGGQVQVDSLTTTYYAQHYFCARRLEI